MVERSGAILSDKTAELHAIGEQQMVQGAMNRAEKRTQIALAFLVAQRCANLVDAAIHPGVVTRHRVELHYQVHKVPPLEDVAANQAGGEKAVESPEVGPRFHKSARVEEIFYLGIVGRPRIDLEFRMALEEVVDHSLALGGCDAAYRINDRTADAHQRRCVLEHPQLDSRHPRGIVRPEAPSDFRMLAQRSQSRARCVEEKVAKT